jgi:hypothetical protein
MSLGAERLGSFGGGNVWFKGADGERRATRVDSRDTHGMYSSVYRLGRTQNPMPARVMELTGRE